MTEKVEINIGKTVENGIMSVTKRMSLAFFPQWSTTDRPKPLSRLVNKDGSYHVDHLQAPNSLMKKLRDSFYFLLSIKWRWIILGSAVCFPLTWALFAVIYYAIAYVNGDFAVPAAVNGTNAAPEDLPTPCITNIKGFADMFLFSVESQTTVGYGFRYPSDQCPWLIVVLCVQYVAGAILQGMICGIVWARLVRPKHRGQEVVFSENAVVNQNKEGNLCLTVRVSDIVGNHLNNLAVRMYFVEKKRMWNAEEEMFSFRLIHMNVGQDNGSNSMLLLWPTLITHVIDENSPLYGYGKNDFERGEFEIIALVEGSVEATGLTAQTRTSYLPHEILWGRRFQPMNFIGRHKSKVKVHYKEFENTCHLETPTVSAKKLDELLKGRGSVSQF